MKTYYKPENWFTEKDFEIVDKEMEAKYPDYELVATGYNVKTRQRDLIFERIVGV